jgi:hypothetical protein
MAVFQKTELILKQAFDPKVCQHKINGEIYVLHCHHYMTLYTQLAMDCGMLDGRRLLSESSEDTFFPALMDYYSTYNINKLADKISIAEQYYAMAGLGQMKVTCAGPDSGEVELIRSHVDEGWLKKFGPKEEPINFVTQGFIAALFSALFNRSPRSFKVLETSSIVKGAKKSTFEVVAI